MRDEARRSPYNVLNVPRDADTEAVEAAFARLYKAARRAAGGDRRRQELNNALEALRDWERRAAAEVRCYHVPLDPSDIVPAAEDLAQELLPLELEPPSDPAAAVPLPQVSDVVGRYLAKLEEQPWPDDRELVRALVARVVLERVDPWTDKSDG